MKISSHFLPGDILATYFNCFSIAQPSECQQILFPKKPMKSSMSTDLNSIRCHIIHFSLPPFIFYWPDLVSLKQLIACLITCATIEANKNTRVREIQLKVSNGGAIMEGRLVLPVWRRELRLQSCRKY